MAQNWTHYHDGFASAIVASFVSHPSRKKLRRRPEFDLKMKLVGFFNHPNLFPGQTSSWQLTAAQRALLMGPDKNEKNKPKKMLSAADIKVLEAKNVDVLKKLDEKIAKIDARRLRK